MPDDLYDYLGPAVRRKGRPARMDQSEWTVADDWPEQAPITEAEIEVFEAWFGDLFDKCFQPAADPFGLEIAVTIPARAALYLRVSTDRQAHNDLSISDQRRQAKGYCASRGWEIVADHVEPGLSATDDRRPEFQRMIEAATTKPPICFLRTCSPTIRVGRMLIAAPAETSPMDRQSQLACPRMHRSAPGGS